MIKNNIEIKINNIEVIFKICLDKFNKTNMIIKEDNNIRLNLIILDIEFLNSVRSLYLYQNDNLNYNDILNILNENINSNILI